ncbi:MAG: hypothetical protein V1723_04490 [Candidatus Uhrbacteria bacterium]
MTPFRLTATTFVIFLASAFLPLAALANGVNAPAPAGPSANSLQGRLDTAGHEAGYETGGGQTQLATMIGRIINGTGALLGVIFVAQMVYAGWLWMTARDEAEQMEKAKHIIRRSIVGLAIVIGAWSITIFVLGRLYAAAK